jgi:predicted GIY-YIG superfamily endonuclease
MTSDYTVYAFFDNNGVPFYFGITKNMKKRVADHLKKIKNSKLPKYHKVNKLLKEGYSFLILILENELTKEEAIAKEIELISIGGKYLKKLYNLTSGGDGGDTFTNNPKKENIREKCKTFLGKKHTELSKKLMSSNNALFWKGKKQPNSMTIKRSLSLSGKPSHMSGKNHTEYSKKLISQNNSKYWLGKNHSEETKDKLRELRKYQDISYLHKIYKLTSPNEEIFIIKDGLEKFCKPLGLIRTKLILVAQGKRKHHKKWKCEYLKGDSCD